VDLAVVSSYVVAAAATRAVLRHDDHRADPTQGLQPAVDPDQHDGHKTVIQIPSSGKLQGWHRGASSMGDFKYYSVVNIVIMI
jgi:hypothetical protein